MSAAPVVVGVLVIGSLLPIWKDYQAGTQNFWEFIGHQLNADEIPEHITWEEALDNYERNR